MKVLIFILAGLYTSWHYTNLYSDSFLLSGIAPFMVLVFLLALAIWLVLKAGMGQRTDNNDYYGGGDFDGSGD